MSLKSAKENGYAPNWMDDEAYEICIRYLADDEQTPADLYHRLARKAANYLGEEFYSPLYECFWRGFLSPATPVATNYGATRVNIDGKVVPKGLPISCYGLQPHNSINGIFSTAREAAIISKNGGGLGINLSDLVGQSPVTHWARIYDTTVQVVSQGGVRRGAVALYLDIEHPDILAFLHAKNTLEGDPRTKLDNNIAVIIKDSFMEKLRNGDQEAANVFSKVLELRMKKGSPYLFFVDTANKSRGADYDALDLKISTSQLCNEIALYCDNEHSFVCVLSSLIASRYHTFKYVTWEIEEEEWNVPMLGIAFLEAVTEGFLEIARDIPGMENAVRFTEKSRALGLGIAGWHRLLQKNLIPFDSTEAYELNEELWKYIKDNAVKASLLLGEKFGIPEWCQTSKQRHTHLLASAPTLANSVLSAAGSISVEPIASNKYTYVGVAGNATRYNTVLVEYLNALGLDTPDIWKSIVQHEGSIQHLRTEIEKACASLPEDSPYNGTNTAETLLEVFKTAYEIDQKAIIQQAADRQKYICQGQSINLFIRHSADAQEVANLHFLAWSKGLKGLYYVRSTSPRIKSTTIEDDKPSSSWHLETLTNCTFCAKAKSLLAQQKISYTTTEVEIPEQGPTYPRVYLNQEYIGGYTELAEYFSDTEEPKVCDISSKDQDGECTACHA